MSQKKTCYYYLPLTPARKKYSDKGNSVILSIPCESGSKLKELALLGNHREIHLIRLKITNLNEEKIPLIEAKQIDAIKEHILASLRLTYDPEVDIARYAGQYLQFHNFVEDGKPELAIVVSELPNAKYRINVKNIESTICATNKPEINRAIRLLTDSQLATLPIQYKYLSLYKILEMAFSDNKEEIKRRKQFLSEFEEDFKELKISKKSLYNFIEEYRAKCAHIETGKLRSPGILGIASDDARALYQFMPLFLTIIKRHINEYYSKSGLKIL